MSRGSEPTCPYLIECLLERPGRKPPAARERRSSLSMSVTSSSSETVRQAGSRQRKENRSRPFDGDSVLRQGSWRRASRSAERVTRFISGRRRGVGEGADDQKPDDQPQPRARARATLRRPCAACEHRTCIMTRAEHLSSGPRTRSVMWLCLSVEVL